MAQNIYQVMKDATDSRDIDEFGLPYPDIMTFPINRFRNTKVAFRVWLDEFEVDKFMLVSRRSITNQGPKPRDEDLVYGTPIHDDFVLWVNNIEFKGDVEAGDEVFYPAQKDITEFYNKYKSNVG
jgi:hypothetical protein